MLWRMLQNGVQRVEAARPREFMRTIWISDGSVAVRDFFAQRCSTYSDGTALISGTIDLSSYLSDSKGLKLVGRANLVFRIGLNFDQVFYRPPVVSMTGNIRSFGAKSLNERRFMPVTSNITRESCDIVVDLHEADRALDGLFVSWTAIGPTPLRGGNSVQ